MVYCWVTPKVLIIQYFVHTNYVQRKTAYDVWDSGWHAM